MAEDDDDDEVLMLAAGDQWSNLLQTVYLFFITFLYFYPALPFILPTYFLTLPL